MDENQLAGYADKNQLPPPSERIPAIRWLKQNLFSSWFNAILTIVSTVLIVTIVFGLLRWALGARWEVIPANLKLLLVGTYPVEHLWRVWATVYLIAFLLGFSSGAHGGLMRRVSTTAALVSVVLAVLPFPWGTRGWLLGIAVAAAAGFGLGYLGKGIRWCKRLEIASWILSFPISLIFLNGVGGILPVIKGRTMWGQAQLEWCSGGDRSFISCRRAIGPRTAEQTAGHSASVYRVHRDYPRCAVDQPAVHG